jgi:hypothetical protein
MTSRLSLLFASTALIVALGLPALAAMQTQGSAPDQCSGVCAAVLDADELSVPLIRVSGDDDDDDDGGWVRRGHDDDEDDEDCDDDDGDDGDDVDCTGALGNPAPAGTVAPPANGLFGNGAPPVAVTN